MHEDNNNPIVELKHDSFVSQDNTATQLLTEELSSTGTLDNIWTQACHNELEQEEKIRNYHN